MSSKDVRRGITNARINEEAFGIIGFESIVVAIAMGLLLKSWLVFGGVFLGLIIIFTIPKIRVFIIGLFCIGWAVLGYFIGVLIGSIGASITFCVLLLITSLGLHMQAIEYLDDIGE